MAAPRQTATTWHLVIDLSDRRLTVYRQGRAVRRFSGVIGAPATPTPRGRYFVEESVLLTGGQVGGPYALALSARSIEGGDLSSRIEPGFKDELGDLA